ncbi:hypothetical protein FM037_13825 [Shewanella psychropiezotolerans]|uniref:Orphan protein n=1 Tax=Shewanella psychropiezotolerans TaxID=2593655 RepID=A0ABX5WYD1_9GAMM|nr:MULTISPECIES: hypothetical protein [Shewanella]MPY23807.1 hypothetical protein [Shewanella sp. YLB-07]QDO84116.1 hypothetical protein FM037_13825 [Shewanella psychropiezotolerans]
MAFIQRFNIHSTTITPAASLTALIVIGALSSVTSQTFDSATQASTLATASTPSQGVQLSFNRYQAGFACRENGWEFCEKWAYPRGLLA